MIDSLNRRFAIDDQLVFRSGPGGLPQAQIRGPLASADIFLHGAHVSSYQPQGSDELLWMSPESAFADDQPIRGGVPICWPWFGPHGSDLPIHGFARLSHWDVSETERMADGAIAIALRLVDREATRSIWPHPFELSMRVTVGDALTMQLSCHNPGAEPFSVEAALHTYFHVDDITRVSIHGLEGRSYVDKLDSMAVKTLPDVLTIDREVDRVFVDTSDCVLLRDGDRRTIEIEKSGSRATVVWNPWIDKSQAMGDFPDAGYRSMICIEATNALQDAREIGPGETHTLGQTCRVRDA